jgi:hypothetical protein
MVSEGCYSSASVIGEEFKVEEGSAAAWEPGQNLVPASLILVAMGELNMDMLKRD